jgi:hypothetical protein
MVDVVGVGDESPVGCFMSSEEGFFYLSVWEAAPKNREKVKVRKMGAAASFKSLLILGTIQENRQKNSSSNSLITKLLSFQRCLAVPSLLSLSRLDRIIS